MPTEHHLNAAPFWAADQEHHAVAAAYPLFSKGHFQQDNGLCYKASIITGSIQENDSDFLYSAGTQQSNFKLQQKICRLNV